MANANVVNVTVIKAMRAQRVNAQNPMRLARSKILFVITVGNACVTTVIVREDTRGPTAKRVLIANVRVIIPGKKTSKQFTLSSTKLLIAIINITKNTHFSFIS